MNYFQDIGHYFCPECRFYYKTHDKQGYTIEQIQEEKTRQLSPDNNNNKASGKITTNRGTIPFGASTFVKSELGRNVDVVPASFTAKSRTINQVEEAKRKAGYDKELEKLEKEYGYTIVSCSETVLQPDGTSSTTNYYNGDEEY